LKQDTKKIDKIDTKQIKSGQIYMKFCILLYVNNKKIIWLYTDDETNKIDIKTKIEVETGCKQDAEKW